MYIKIRCYVYFSAIGMVQGKATVLTGMPGDFLLPPLFMLGQKNENTEATKTADPAVTPTVVQNDILLQPRKVLRQKDTDSETAPIELAPGVYPAISTGKLGDVLLPPLFMLRQKNTNSEATKTADSAVTSAETQDDILLPPLIMLRQKNTDSETKQIDLAPGVYPAITTGKLGDVLLPPPFMIRQKSKDSETATPGVPHTHNECTCNSNEEIDSNSGMDMFSMIYTEFFEETAYYEEGLAKSKGAGRRRRHHKRHGNHERRHRSAPRLHDLKEESPAVANALPGIEGKHFKK